MSIPSKFGLLATIAAMASGLRPDSEEYNYTERKVFRRAHGKSGKPNTVAAMRRQALKHKRRKSYKRMVSNSRKS